MGNVSTGHNSACCMTCSDGCLPELGGRGVAEFSFLIFTERRNLQAEPSLGEMDFFGSERALGNGFRARS